MLMVNQLVGFGAYDAAAGKVLTFQTSAFSNTDLTTYTFASQAIGTAAADRYVVVGVGGSNISGDISTVAVGGTGLTKIITSADAAHRGSIYAGLITSGTTADIVVTWGAGVNRCGIGVWSLTGISSEAAHHTATATTGALSSLNTLSAGVAVAYVHPNAGPTSWTNATERFDDALESSTYSSGADITATTGSAVTITPTHGAGFAGAVAASW